MRFTPKSKSKLYMKLSGIFMLISLALIALSAFSMYYASLIQLFAVIFITASIFLPLRWGYYSYRYEVLDGEITVTQLQGQKKEVDVLRMPLSKITEIKKGLPERKLKRYDYRVSMLENESLFTLRFDDRGDVYDVILEATPEFIDYIERERHSAA